MSRAMRRTFLLVIALVLLASVTGNTEEPIKEADLAGSWYPSSNKALSAVLDNYFNLAKVEPIEGDIRAIIVPHAGLVYSGAVAAYAYKAIQGKNYTTVLILGFCHRKSFDGVSVYKEGYFETPLGNLAVDSKLANEIISRDKKIIFYPEAFNDENSIELELPFIKKALPEAKIVPIAFGSGSFKYCKLMTDILVDVLKDRKDIIIIASSDMSHYHSYEEARRIDSDSISLIKNLSAREIYEKSVTREQIFCGYMPITATLLTSKDIGADKVAILQYANSGDVTGDKKRVVGYVSAVIYEDFQQGREEQKGEKMLSEVQRKRLLEIARESIKTYLKTGKVLEVTEDDPVLNRKMGAFVTLHNKGRLRGCIGNIIGRGPLYLTIRDMAIESTLDPRFILNKVTLREMDKIDIEISVLSELKKITDVNKIEMGVHGVLVRKGVSSGVYLPQVATEMGWSREEFLTSLCANKAGFSPDAWKTGEIDIYIFTAEVFGEKNE
jgi:MEMO1 family protein